MQSVTQRLSKVMESFQELLWTLRKVWHVMDGRSIYRDWDRSDAGAEGLSINRRNLFFFGCAHQLEYVILKDGPYDDGTNM